MLVSTGAVICYLASMVNSCCMILCLQVSAQNIYCPYVVTYIQHVGLVGVGLNVGLKNFKKFCF